jgi:hypothetical protein
MLFKLSRGWGCDGEKMPGVMSEVLNSSDNHLQTDFRAPIKSKYCSEHFLTILKHHMQKKGKAILVNRPRRLIDLCNIKAPTFYRKSAQRWWRGEPYAPKKDSWYSFLSEDEQTPRLMCGWKV